MSILSRFRKEGGVQKLLTILEESDDKTRTNLLHQMTEEDAAFTDEIKSQLFLWENVLEQDQETLSKILEAVPLKPLATAMLNLQDAQLDMLFAAAGERLKRRIVEEFETLSAATPPMIHVSRRRVCQVGRELERNGMIKLRLPGSQKS